LLIMMGSRPGRVTVVRMNVLSIFGSVAPDVLALSGLTLAPHGMTCCRVVCGSAGSMVRAVVAGVVTRMGTGVIAGM
jgi:hypothetical protein